MRRFRDRADAGRVLAHHLEAWRGRDEVVVLGLPRGGVPVAAEVAAALGAPLDVFVVRKLGVPGHEELAMGAIAAGGVRVVNDEVVRALRIRPDDLARVAQREAAGLVRREEAYRIGRPPLALAGAAVVLVDDGLATGSTMRAAVLAARQHGPASVVVAVPTGSREACELLREVADEVVCATSPEPFAAVGLVYEDFTQTTDEQVAAALASAAS